MKLDLRLLKRLLVIDHPSQNEWPMISAIINECYKIPNLEFEMDEYSNILITKNTNNPELYVCVVAHMDCVLGHANKAVKIKNGKIFGENPFTGKQIGLGADDTCGICIALQLLKQFDDLKVCFTTEEEFGYLGAKCAAENINFFCNVSYLIQADRMGKSNLITFTNGIYIASEEWLQEVTPLMAKYNYSEEVGLGTDIGVLSEKLQLSGVNISCGYYKHHTNNEYIIISEMQNCLNFMEDIIKTVPLDKQYEIVVKYTPYNVSYRSYPSEDDYSDFYDDIPCNKCETYDCMNCPYENLWATWRSDSDQNSETKFVY